MRARINSRSATTPGGSLISKRKLLPSSFAGSADTPRVLFAPSACLFWFSGSSRPPYGVSCVCRAHRLRGLCRVPRGVPLGSGHDRSLLFQSLALFGGWGTLERKMSLSRAKAPIKFAVIVLFEREMKTICCERLLPNSTLMQQSFATNSTLENATRKLLQKGSLLQHSSNLTFGGGNCCKTLLHK